MANTDKDIVITPNKGQAANPSIVVTGADNAPGTLTVNNDGSLTFNKNFSVSSATVSGNITVNGDIYGRSVNAAYTNIYRIGGIYFTWDSDSYGTNFEHSITSTDNGVYSDDLTINSYGHVRINVDSNNNGENTFTIGVNTTGTANTRFTLDESGNATATGSYRTPIFYDSANTAYYTDPASTSNLLGLTVANTITGSISGNAGTATTLQTARTINGTSFNGSANITTANWGTARTLTIGATGKSVNGSGNVSWTRGEIQVPRTTTTANHGIETDESCVAYVSGISLLGQSDGALYSHVYSSVWKHQIYGDYRTGQIAIRGRNNGTWQAWRTVVDSSNVNSYAVGLSGNQTVAGEKTFSNITRINSGIAAWNTTTPGTGIGNLHIGAASATSNAGPALTFGARDASNGTNAQAGIYLNSDGTYGTRMYFATTDSYATGARSAMYIDQAGTIVTQRSYLQAAGSLRAPIFYDSNDTGYYIDPNSTGNTALRMRGGALFGPNVTWGAYLSVGTNGHASGSYASVATTNGNLHLDSVSGYNTYLNWYAGTEILIGAGGSTEIARINSDYFRHSSDVRTPIFYDSDNTAYYVDPATYTNLYGGLQVDGAHGSTRTRLRLPAGNNGAGSGDVNMFMWVSEPGATWTGAGIARNRNNDSGGFPRINTGLSAQMIRFDEGNSIIFYMMTAAGADATCTMTGGAFTASGDITAFSDPRLKENIRPIENALEKVLSVNGVKFTWINSSVTAKSGKEDYGILSSEIEKIAPELVHDSISESPDGDNYKTVAYDKIVPFLIEAIKEQQSIIDNQQTQLTEQNERLTQIEQIVNKLVGNG